MGGLIWAFFMKWVSIFFNKTNQRCEFISVLMNRNSSVNDEDDLDCKSSSGSEDKEVEIPNKDGSNNNTAATKSCTKPASRIQNRKSQNVAALIKGNLEVERKSWLPRVYSVTEIAANLRKPFKSPCSNGSSDNDGHLARRLYARKRFVPWGSTKPVLLAITNRLDVSDTLENSVEEEIVDLPPGVEPLVLWQAEESDCNSTVIAVDPLLVKFLRPHQREGVQFMFECVSGLLSDANINGCILADDMGLGKTLQSITLLYTLLHQGFDGTPMVKKAIIVTPTSLVSNWEAEVNKWLGGRVKLVALCESTRDDAISSIDSFVSPRSKLQVLIISYETFRMHSSKFSASGSCDLLICDEAHRLKNDQTMTNRSLAALTCKRRLLLSGTPMQNDLEEFYAMANFTNPGVLGGASHFRRHYEIPIICGREPTATEEEKKLGSARSAELSAKVNQFILRRTNALLSNHLPPKMIEVVCCKMTSLQTNLYNHIIQSKNVFGPKAQQRSIYDQAISPLVNDVLEGFNCTVFAYGQTGTGTDCGGGGGTVAGAVVVLRWWWYCGGGGGVAAVVVLWRRHGGTVTVAVVVL